MGSPSRSTLGAGLLFVATGALVACNAIWGVDQLSFDSATHSTAAGGTGASGAAPPGGGGLGAGGTGSGAGAWGGQGASAASGGGGPVPCEGAGGDALCVVVPDGWTGPVVAFVGDPDAVPSCPASPGTDLMLLGGLTADASCASCQCVSECDYSDIASFTNSELCIGIAQQAGSQLDTCMNLQAADYPLSVKIDPPDQSCPSTGGGLLTQDPRWTTVGLLCDPVAATGNCSAGICVEQGPSPIFPGACVWRADDSSCPNGFPARYLLSSSDAYVDTRACTACGCAPTQACSASTRFFSNVACGGSSVDVPNDGACHSTNGERHSHSGTMTNGTCVVTQQAELTGYLAPSSGATVTLCCSE